MRVTPRHPSHPGSRWSGPEASVGVCGATGQRVVIGGMHRDGCAKVGAATVSPVGSCLVRRTVGGTVVDVAARGVRCGVTGRHSRRFTRRHLSKQGQRRQRSNRHERRFSNLGTTPVEGRGVDDSRRNRDKLVVAWLSPKTAAESVSKMRLAMSVAGRGRSLLPAAGRRWRAPVIFLAQGRPPLGK